MLVGALETAEIGPLSGPDAGHEKVMVLAVGAGGCVLMQPPSAIRPAAANDAARITPCMTISFWVWCDPSRAATAHGSAGSAMAHGSRPFSRQPSELVNDAPLVSRQSFAAGPSGGWGYCSEFRSSGSCSALACSGSCQSLMRRHISLLHRCYRWHRPSRSALAMTDHFTSPILEARRAQMFPILAANEIERMRRFGTPCRFAAGDRLFETGKPSPGVFMVISGTVRVTGRDGHGNDVALVEHGPGAFSGELGQLSGKRSFADGIAIDTVDALLITADQLRALLIAEASLGEKLVRALILRRVGLIEAGAGGPVLMGTPSAPDVARLRNFLSRNGIPHSILDPATDADAHTLIDDYAAAADDLPLVVCPDGSVLRNPSELLLAKCIGMLDSDGEESMYDVLVAGAGPAGLATAVYAASEGLSVFVIDARSFGGQAGASARIENYLGFPTGISGQALAGRAYVQAQKFGARMLIPAEAVGLKCEPSPASHPFALQLGSGRSVRGRTVVIATGARYRRPACANLAAMEGRGVWYWASPIEARMCAGQEVVLVGGGNSAGQAAVFLAEHASKVWMLVRGAGLAATMSTYLVDRIAATPKIELLTRTEIVGLTGSIDSGVEAVTWRHRDNGHEQSRLIRNVFMFIGADPTTEWLKSCDVVLDEKGFVKTGAGLEPGDATSRNAGRLPLESSIPGLFAIGDVRAGSVKRMGAAIGEGAAVVAQIHSFHSEHFPVTRSPAVG